MWKGQNRGVFEVDYPNFTRYIFGLLIQPQYFALCEICFLQYLVEIRWLWFCTPINQALKSYFFPGKLRFSGVFIFISLNSNNRLIAATIPCHYIAIITAVVIIIVVINGEKILPGTISVHPTCYSNIKEAIVTIWSTALSLIVQQLLPKLPYALYSSAEDMWFFFDWRLLLTSNIGATAFDTLLFLLVWRTASAQHWRCSPFLYMRAPWYKGPAPLPARAGGTGGRAACGYPPKGKAAR